MRPLCIALLAFLSLAVAALGPGEEPEGLLRQFERKLQSPDPAQRQRAIDVLADLLPPADAATALVARLADDHPDVRASASAALVGLGLDAQPALVAALESDDGALRLGAARTLGRLGTEAVGIAEPLAGRLADADPLVRAAALDALAGLGQQATPHAEAIAARLLDENLEVQSAAVAALTRLDLHPPAALPALKQLVEAARDGETRSMARALARAIDPDYLGPLVDYGPPAEEFVYVSPPPYSPVQGIGGTLKSVGSDTMNNLMSLWAEGFRKYYPDVRIEMEGKGSSTAPPRLIAGTADLAPMSRPMKRAEEDEFEKVYGYKPIALPVSLDMLAVFVHRDNPILSLTLPQVDAIFSSTRNLGYEKDIRTWGDLGLRRGFAEKPISMFGRNVASSSYGFFREHVLGKGDFKDTVKEQPGSSVERGVASDRFAIGYGGIGYLTTGVRAVPLAADANSEPVAAENAYSGEYPLSRYLYVYINAKPNSELPPLQREFVRFVFSQEGQAIVVNDGYLPVTAEMAAEALESVGIAAPATVPEE